MEHTANKTEMDCNIRNSCHQFNETILQNFDKVRK
jgi:hypothetical protein